MLLSITLFLRKASALLISKFTDLLLDQPSRAALMLNQVFACSAYAIRLVALSFSRLPKTLGLLSIFMSTDLKNLIFLLLWSKTFFSRR